MTCPLCLIERSINCLRAFYFWTIVRWDFLFKVATIILTAWKALSRNSLQVCIWDFRWTIDPNQSEDVMDCWKRSVRRADGMIVSRTCPYINCDVGSSRLRKLLNKWSFLRNGSCHESLIISQLSNCRMAQAFNEYSLYIPRVALSSSSASSKSSSRVKEFAPKRRTMIGEISETSGESESEGVYSSSIQRYDGLKANRNRMYFVHKAPKRGSNSTQSSSLSSSSTSDNGNYVRHSSWSEEKLIQKFSSLDCQLAAVKREKSGELQQSSFPQKQNNLRVKLRA